MMISLTCLIIVQEKEYLCHNMIEQLFFVVSELYLDTKKQSKKPPGLQIPKSNLTNLQLKKLIPNLTNYHRNHLIRKPFQLLILCLIAFAYCVIKIFFQNIKRGGILLIQMAVGSLYMFSVPRGYTDGFVQWMKQVAAICLTAFMQTTILYLGLLTFPDNMLLGMGILLSANEVPRIAQQFGLDSSVKVNMMSVVHATTTAVNLTRSVARSVK